MKKEYIGYALAVISVIASGVFSSYFYDKSQQTRSPIYSTDVFPSMVFDADDKTQQPFSVISSSGKLIEKDIFLAEHFFWNKGDRPILASEILDPLTVEIVSDDYEMLDVRIEQISRSVVDCKISNLSKNKKSFSITYKVLEKNDGCSVKLFYTGERYPEIVVSGSILGVPEIDFYSETIDNIVENLPWYNHFRRYLPITTALLGCGFLLLILTIKSSQNKAYFLRVLFTFIIIAQISVLVELRYGSGFGISYIRPSTSEWSAKVKSPNKSIQPTAKAAAD
jgi:hypothetical protein